MATTSNRAYRYPTGSDAPNGPLALSQLASDVDADVAALIAATTWTPTLLGSTTNPTIGNSTVIGRYWRTGTNRVDLFAWIKLGSTFTAGSGLYAISLPLAVNSTYNRQAIPLSFYDSSGPGYYRGIAHAGEDAATGVTNLSAAKLMYDNGSTHASLSSTAPVVPAQNDIIHIAGFYYI